MKPAQALAVIGSMTDGARILSGLAGGPASDSYLVGRDADRWVLRIDTEVAAELGLDRGAESFVLGTVYKEHLGPLLQFVDIEAGIQLTRYVPGRTWTRDDLADATNIERVGRLLQRLHGVGPVGKPFALRGRVARYAARIATPTARELAADIDARLRRLAGGETCLCHNDLVSANFVDGERLSLIDWEYAAVGDPFFDLATIVQHHALGETAAIALLRAYRGEARDVDFARLEEFCAVYQRLRQLWQSFIDELAGD